jgi:hypothetical protein
VKTKVTIAQDKEKPVEKVVLAQAILDISAAMKRLSQSPLNRRAILVLTSDASGVNRTTVDTVIDCLESLETKYLKPGKK